MLFQQYNPYLSGQSIKYSSPNNQDDNNELGPIQQLSHEQPSLKKLDEPISLEKQIDSSQFQIGQLDSGVIFRQNLTENISSLSKSAISYYSPQKVEYNNPNLNKSLQHPIRKQIFEDLKVPNIKSSMMIAPFKPSDTTQKKLKIFQELKKQVIPPTLIKFQPNTSTMEEDDEEFKEFPIEQNEQIQQPEQLQEQKAEPTVTVKKQKPFMRKLSHILTLIILPIIITSIYSYQTL